jgi:GNAT superfamily N-acetyltransferase
MTPTRADEAILSRLDPATLASTGSTYSVVPRGPGSPGPAHLVTLRDGPRKWRVAPKAHLISMHVMAEYRGQHVGAQLVEHFKSWAKEKGAVQLRVTAYTANAGAIRFYQRQGFAPLETTLAVDI